MSIKMVPIVLKVAHIAIKLDQDACLQTRIVAFAKIGRETILILNMRINLPRLNLPCKTFQGFLQRDKIVFAALDSLFP